MHATVQHLVHTWTEALQPWALPRAPHDARMREDQSFLLVTRALPARVADYGHLAESCGASVLVLVPGGSAAATTARDLQQRAAATAPSRLAVIVVSGTGTYALRPPAAAAAATWTTHTPETLDVSTAAWLARGPPACVGAVLGDLDVRSANERSALASTANELVRLLMHGAVTAGVPVGLPRPGKGACPTDRDDLRWFVAPRPVAAGADGIETVARLAIQTALATKPAATAETALAALPPSGRDAPLGSPAARTVAAAWFAHATGTPGPVEALLGGARPVESFNATRDAIQRAVHDARNHALGWPPPGGGGGPAVAV